jgi:hypothetical protein
MVVSPASATAVLACPPGGWKTRAVRAAFVRSGAALGVIVATLSLCAAAGAHRGDGVFTVSADPLVEGAVDVAMLADGSVVLVGSQAWHLTPAGQRTPIPDLLGSGIAATADGGLLSIRGGYWDHRVERWTPSAGVSVVAGTGSAGFGGDGGPAQQALLNLSPVDDVVFDATGIVARPDGGFVFVDPGNRRIRAVDAGGTIRTLAGGSSGPFRDPMGLAATPDGGFVVTESFAGRVRRLGADGGLGTLASVDEPNDVVVSPDGTVIVSEPWDGHLWRIAPGSRTAEPYLRAARATETFDFAARATFGRGLALDQQGGLLALGPETGSADDDNTELTYVPNGATSWPLAALRSTRTSRRGVSAVIETTQPGTATLTVVDRDRTVASVTQQVGQGHSTLRARGLIRSRWYELRLRLDADGGASADDGVPIHGARRLTVPLARALLGRRQGNVDDVAIYRLGQDCKPFGTRRVDCEIQWDRRCAGIASLTLHRTGIVLRRHYSCGRPRFRRHPRFNVDGNALQRLSRGDGGVWDDDLGG